MAVRAIVGQMIHTESSSWLCEPSVASGTRVIPRVFLLPGLPNVPSCHVCDPLHLLVWFRRREEVCLEVFLAIHWVSSWILIAVSLPVPQGMGLLCSRVRDKHLYLFLSTWPSSSFFLTGAYRRQWGAVRTFSLSSFIPYFFGLTVDVVTGICAVVCVVLVSLFFIARSISGCIEMFEIFLWSLAASFGPPAWRLRKCRHWIGEGVRHHRFLRFKRRAVPSNGTACLWLSLLESSFVKFDVCRCASICGLLSSSVSSSVQFSCQFALLMWSTRAQTRGSIKAPLVPGRVQGDGHGITMHVVATFCMAICRSTFNRVSDSPR